MASSRVTARSRLSDTIRCFLDGDDVTRNTRACCVLAGWIDLYCVNAAGKHYVDPETHEVAIERRYGDVVVTV